MRTQNESSESETSKASKKSAKADVPEIMKADAKEVETSAAESVPHNLSFSDIESVDQLRDELNLQAHLLRSELKERFEKIEKEWPILNIQLEPIRNATTQASADVSAAVRLLFDTVRESYQDIKRSASSH